MRMDLVERFHNGLTLDFMCECVQIMQRQDDKFEAIPICKVDESHGQRLISS